MTRTRWTLSAVTLLALWLIGAFLLVPRMQHELETAAKQTIAQQSTLAQRLGRLRLAFDGQQAHLSGSVRTIQDRLTIEATMRDLVRAPTPLSASIGLRLNPVCAVQNEIEVVPYPTGWMLLAASGKRARLLGTAASEYEARDLARSVQESWSVKGGRAEGDLGADGKKHDEAANVSATLRSVPEPQHSTQAHLAIIGQPWREISLEQPDESLRAEALSLGISEIEWQQRMLPALHELRDTLQQQRAAETENNHLAKLAAGHLFIAVRDQQVILRGEIGSAAMKRAILDDAISVFSPRRLVDEIRISSERRPTGDFGPITTALLPLPKEPNGKSFYLGLSGKAWKPVDWQIAREAQPWKTDLPTGLDAAKLQNDSATLIDWLQGADTVMLAPAEPQPAIVTLALFGSKAILSGQIAEESLRAQLVAAVRQAYAPRILVLSDELRINGNCRSSGSAFHTLKSLPTAPAADSAGIFAIATPDSIWTIIPVTLELVEAGGITKSKLLPAGTPAALIEQLSAEAIEQLRIHLQSKP